MLQNVLLDVVVDLNCRPLTYLEDDIQMLTLTPNAMLFACSTFAYVPELAAQHLEDTDLQKLAKYLSKHIVKRISTWFQKTSQPEA